MLQIALTKGCVALVDDEDYDMLMHYKWKAGGKHGLPLYAIGYLLGSSTVRYHMHRLVIGAVPGQIVDHINRNGLDNRRANLRIVTCRENNINKSTRSNATGFRGIEYVSWNKTPSWRTRIDQQKCGVFTSAEQAARTYDCLARIRHGRFARLNFAYRWPDEQSSAAPTADSMMEG